MPELFCAWGYHIYIWTNEGRPTEPIHVHVSLKPHSNATKIWITSKGDIEVANNNDQIKSSDLKKICAFLKNPENQEEIKAEWKRIFQHIKFIDQQK